jgi:thioesterase domain-containing protein
MMGKKFGPEVVCLKQSGQQPPLFLCASLSGNVLCYAELAEALPLDRPIYGIQSSAIAGKREPAQSLEASGWHMMEAILAVQPSGSYGLAGWSFGALLALEAARQLQHSGRSVDFLGMIDNQALAEVSDQKKENSVDLEAAQLLANDLGRQSGRTIIVADFKPELESLGLYQQAFFIKQHSASLLPTESIVHLLRLYRANLQALWSYTAKMSPEPIHFWRARDEAVNHIRDPSQPWRAYAPKGLRLYDTPGDHFSCLSQPHVQALAASMAAVIGGDAG